MPERNGSESPAVSPGRPGVETVPDAMWNVDIAAHPEWMVEPVPLVPYVAWPGRLTELAGPDKLGKSTLMRQAAIAVATDGWFLGGRVQRETNGRGGRVLWFGLEEAPADFWRPMMAMGCPTESPSVCFVRRLPDYDAFHAHVGDAAQWDLIQIDTFAAFGYSLGMESERDETETTRIMHELVGVARAGPAVVFNHHVTKAESPRERGSGAIAATADVVLRLSERKHDPTVIDATARGRLPVASFAMRKEGGKFVMADLQDSPIAAAVSDAERVVEYVQNHPGESLSTIAGALHIRKGTTAELLVGLGSLGRVQNLGSFQRGRYIVPENAPKAASGSHGSRGSGTTGTTTTGESRGVVAVGTPYGGGNYGTTGTTPRDEPHRSVSNDLNYERIEREAIADDE